MKFPEPIFYILPESFWLEQSEDRGDASACGQAAQHPAGKSDQTFTVNCQGICGKLNLLTHIISDKNRN